MKFLMANLYLLLFGVFLLFDGVAGQQFLQKYKTAIQTYIMAGEENGWGQHCDTLSAGTYSNDGIPQITMALDKINMLNFKYSSSKCLLVNYAVTSKAELSALLEFGRAAIYHVSLALILKMRSGVTLGMATNTSKLPYLVAAESSQGKEQFLCPVLGEPEPRLQKHFCKQSYASYENKRLRVALIGVPPSMIYPRPPSDTIDGTVLRLLKMLAQRLRFMGKIILPRSFIDAQKLVGNPGYRSGYFELDFIVHLPNFSPATETLT